MDEPKIDRRTKENRHLSKDGGKRTSARQAYLLANENRYKPRCAKDEIDLSTIEKLFTIGCTHQEIADILKVSYSWLENEIRDNPHMALAAATGKANMKASLRRQQYEVAMTGNVPMLIWLGKQYLDQSDKREDKTEHTVNVLVKSCMEELDQLGRDKILEARRVLRDRSNDSSEVSQSSENETGKADGDTLDPVGGEENLDEPKFFEIDLPPPPGWQGG